MYMQQKLLSSLNRFSIKKMGDTLRYKVLLAVVILLLASIFVSTMAVGQGQGRASTRVENFTVSINGTSIEIDPVSGEKSDVISPDSPNPYSLKVVNMQPYVIDFTLKIKNIPTDWEAYFADTTTSTHTVTVSQNSQEVVNIIVLSSVFNTYNMTIDATSSVEGGTKSDYILLTCKEDPIKITPDSMKKYAGAGKGVKYELSIKNNYDQSWEVDLGVSAGIQASDQSMDNDWAFKFDQSLFNIGNLATITKNLTIFAPKNASPSDEKVFMVEGTVTGDSKVYYSVEIKCVVKEVYNLSVYINPREISANPGESLNYTLRVVNHADNSDRVGIQVVGDSDPWPFVFSGAINTLVKQFNIDAHQTKYVYLALTVPPNAEAGQHTLAINVTGKGGTNTHEIITNVNESHKVTLSYSDEVIELEQDGNKVYPITLADNTFRIKFKNDGNTQETAKIKIKDIESGWQVAFIAVESGSSITNTTPANPAAPIDINVLGIKYSFSQEATEITLNVQRFFQVYLVLSVQPPTGAPATLHSFALTVEYGPQLVIPNFIVNMTLSISNIEILDLDGDLNNGPDFVVLNPNSTNKLKLQITIRNNYPLATTDFDVILYIDFKFADEEDRVNIESIQPGEEKDVVLTWDNPEGGYHYVDIIVKGSSIGTNEPQARGQVVVQEDDSDNTAFWIIIFIIAILILLIIAGVIIYMRIKTLGTSEDKEAEEYERLYGDGKKRKKDEEELDSDTEDYLHGAKHKSRKSKREMDKDAEKLYGDDDKKTGRRKGGRRRRDQDEDEPKGKKHRLGPRDEKESKKGRRGRKKPDKPRRGKASKFDDDEDYL
jgi:uncharacterized membrane protein